VDNVASKLVELAKQVYSETVFKDPFGNELTARVCGLAHEYACQGIQTSKRIVEWHQNGMLRAVFQMDSAARSKSPVTLLASSAAFRFWVYYGQSPQNARELLSTHDIEGRICLVHIPEISLRKDRFGSVG